MKQENRVIIFILLILLLLIGGAIWGGNYLGSKTDPTPLPTEKPEDLPITGPVKFETTAFNFEDRFTIDLVKGWELVSEQPDQRVDRYRFEKENGTTSGILTLSFYDAGDITTFDQLVERRYGGAYLDQTEDLEIDGKQAKRIVASFLGNGAGVRQGADLLIEIEEGYFISVNGLHYKEGEDAALMLSQIDFMQTSFREE